VNAAAGPEGPTAFDPPYDRLAPLPRGVWLPVLTCSAGAPATRLDDARHWQERLLAGVLPNAGADFGDAACAALRRVVADLDLPALARGVPAVAEQVLRTLLWHLDRLPDLQGELTRSEAIAATAADFRAAWVQQKVSLEPELFLLRQWADTAQLRWDELQGQLHRREWQAAQRAADRLAELPELMALLQRLGRREFSTREREQAAPQEAAAPQRLPQVAVSTRLPGAPGEITGIRLDSRLEHMLPSEAMWLRHPLLRRVWRARQAEGRLLANDTEAVVVDWRPDPAGTPQAPPARPAQHALERGPIVLCLDTSGSMRGAPEHIAKAVAIAALRVAHAGRRACKLVAFGGPGEVLERDLTSGVDGGAKGLAAVLDLMGQAFDGGTDVQTPIERAIECVHEEGWAGADLLIVSDGEFGCVPATLERLEDARQRLGLFVQGVLVGDRETMGMLDVCDHIHWVRDWRRHADEGARGERGSFSPVHSQSLTALYFPNALSPRAAKHHPKPT
jgi:uncharacterized protein with von Willebrand factor type A (vWA) domain